MITVDIIKRDQYGDVCIKSISMVTVPRIGETIYLAGQRETANSYGPEQVLKVEDVRYRMPRSGGYSIEIICSEGIQK